jgi:hypothetical protein
VVSVETGLYEVSVRNAAPFSSGEETGYAVFVQAVGSNAHCFEQSTYATNDATYTLVSRIRCVTPSANPASDVNVNSDFAWSYRADSSSYPQLGASHPVNFAYARVDRANGATVVEQTFHPSPTRRVLGTRTESGAYTIVFKDLNPWTGGAAHGYLNNVIVQKTCDKDAAASCSRSVCSPHSWTSGSFAVADTTVHVRCYGPDGAPRDTDFRVFVGDGPHNSQALSEPDFGIGGRYGFLLYSSPRAKSACFAPATFTHRFQHETPSAHVPSVPSQVCKTATGKFVVEFDASYFLGNHVIAPYHQDAISPVVSGRATRGGYCNAHNIECNGSTCTGNAENPPSRLHVRCYTAAGALQDAAWNLSLFY